MFFLVQGFYSNPDGPFTDRCCDEFFVYLGIFLIIVKSTLQGRIALSYSKCFTLPRAAEAEINNTRRWCLRWQKGPFEEKNWVTQTTKTSKALFFPEFAEWILFHDDKVLNMRSNSSMLHLWFGLTKLWCHAVAEIFDLGKIIKNFSLVFPRKAGKNESS